MRDFPGSPVIKTPLSNAEGMDSIPGWRGKAPHASECGQKFRKKKKKTFDNTEYPFLKKVLSKLEQGMKGVTINLQLTS